MELTLVRIPPHPLARPHVRVVTLPGEVFFLPNEAPKAIADVVVEAVAAI